MVDFLALTERLERVHSGRLALRQPAVSDAWPLFLATRNALFNRHLLWSQPEDELQVWDRVQAIVDATRRGSLSAVSAVVRQTGAWVSLFRFQPYRQQPGVVELGVWTHPAFWQGRVSLELGRACVDAAFALSDVRELVGAAAPANKSSCRLMAACGMAPGAVTPRLHEQGHVVELMEFRLTREAWLQQQPYRAFELTEPRALRPQAPVPPARATRPDPEAAAVPAPAIVIEPLTIDIALPTSEPRRRPVAPEWPREGFAQTVPGALTP